MYSTVRAEEIKSNDVKVLSTGIHENVKLVGARAEKSKNGNMFLEIKFEKNGAGLIQTEWEPTAFNGMSEADVQEKCDKQFARMLQILKCFYKPEALMFVGSNFAEFAKWVCDLLNSANKETLLRVKIVYNKGGYTTLPAYAKYTFIEPMNLPEGVASAIVALNIDDFEKIIVADKESDKSNPLAGAAVNTATSTPSADALPF